MHSDEPYLLLEGLTGRESERNTASQLLDQAAVDKFCTWCQGPGVVLGVTGIGKTRTTYEYLAKHCGLYFVADTHRNGEIRVSICIVNQIDSQEQKLMINSGRLVGF